MERVYAFLDTNNWIYLCNGFDIQTGQHRELHHKLFSFLEEQVNIGRLAILVNEIILEEFDRNESAARAQIKNRENRSNGFKGTLQSLRKELPEFIDIIQKLGAAVDQKQSEFARQEIDHITRVKKFLYSETIRIDITSNQKVAATDMAVAKKAPFIGDKKNSTADALHILSASGYIESHARIIVGSNDKPSIEFPKSVFVSSNSRDFAHPKDPSQIHPDLAPILNRSNITYVNTLAGLQDILEVEFLTTSESEFILEADTYSCKSCSLESAEINYYLPEEVFDPRKNRDSIDPNQLAFLGDQNSTRPFTKIILADCDHCGADYIVCPDCESLIEVADTNIIIDCESCNFKFIQHTEYDRKGLLYLSEIEIVETYKCRQCENNVEHINEDQLCEECEEYYNI